MTINTKKTNLCNANSIEISNMSFGFVEKKTNSIDVLSNISLQVKEGELVTIVGPSGCGKTTLLKIIGGLINQKGKNISFQGTVKIYGKEPEKAKKSRVFGFAFQNPVLLPWRTVIENIVLPLEILNENDFKNTKEIVDLLKLMGVENFSNSYPMHLSGGMQQRVNIARALVHKPKILLMDEPFGSLDEVTRERLVGALMRIHRIKKSTIIYVTHSLREATFLGDRILLLTERPAKIKEIFNSTLPYNRDISIQYEGIFLDILSKVRSGFFELEQDE